MSQNKHLTNLLRSLIEKRYADAQTHLNLVIEAKLKGRIKNAKSKGSKKKDMEDETKLQVTKPGDKKKKFMKGIK